ncbi:major capsid protein [Streptomyces sp. NPDC088739]|uniref:major capsid protein n=1 Tax=Streptomyces sp. NPDC088739 TaxID=3365882 RepID=UPI00381D6515
MAKHLDDLLARLREVASDAEDAAEQRKTLIAAAVAEDDVDLAGLADGVVQKSTAVAVDENTEITEEQVEYLSLLSEVSEGVNARVEEIEEQQAAEARKATAAALAEKIRATRSVEAPALAPVPPPASAPPSEGDPGDGGAPVDTAAVVAASGKPRTRVPLGTVRPNTDRAGARRQPIEGTIVQHHGTAPVVPERYSMVASSDIPGFFSGQELPSMDSLVSAAAAKFNSLSRHNASGGRAGIATFNRTVDPRTRIDNEMVDWRKLDDVANERLLPGGSLIASMYGGTPATSLTASTPAVSLGAQAPDVSGFGYAWCSPMEIINQLCPLEGTLEAMVDLPTITTTKGGVMWPHTPDYTDLFKDTPFCFTEEDMGGTSFEKPCIKVPCADGWDQCVLDACSLCIIDNILLSRVDDSQIQRAIAQGLLIYRRGLNAKRIKRMLDLTKSVSGGFTVVSADQLRQHGPGMFESILSFFELQVEHLRARKRLGRNTTFEGLAPTWLRAVLRADLSKKNGIQDRWTVTDADVDRWLAQRGIRLQYVWEFQDAGVDPNSPIGGDIVPLNWPSKVQILLYQAGTFTAIQGPSVQLDAVYDREGIQRNERVRLFMEDMWCLVSRCGIKQLYEIPLCPNGVSGGQEVIDCTPPTPPNPPAAVTALAAPAGQIEATQVGLTWNWTKGTGATDGDVTGFEARYRTPAGSGTWSAAKSFGASARTGTLTGLTAEKEYEIEVVAVGSGGKSTPATVNATTAAAAALTAKAAK